MNDTLTFLLTIELNGVNWLGLVFSFRSFSNKDWDTRLFSEFWEDIILSRQICVKREERQREEREFDEFSQ